MDVCLLLFVFCVRLLLLVSVVLITLVKMFGLEWFGFVDVGLFVSVCVACFGLLVFRLVLG